jgi:acetyltransferase-like isoleucine patch superfamily enzyme
VTSFRRALRWVYRSLTLLLPQRRQTPCCVLGEGARLHPSASIANQSGRPENVTIGRGTHIAGHLTVWANCGVVRIGDECYVGEGTRLFAATSIWIGNRVQIAHGCNVMDNNIHSLDAGERHREFLQNVSGGLVRLHDLRESPVVIEDDAWIGASAVILKGTTIGTGAIVGAGAVVTKDVPAFAVAIGNPARVVKLLPRPGESHGSQAVRFHTTGE